MPPQTSDDNNTTSLAKVNSADLSSSNAFEMTIADVSKESHATLFAEEALHAPEPIISKHSVLSIGFLVFVLATVWPPSILLLAYLASVLIPYCYRENDDASTRRHLLHKFDQEDKIFSVRRAVPDNVEVVNGYWTNPRGLLLHYTILKPKEQFVKAVVCHCHGYTDSPTYTRRNELTYMVQHGGLAVIMVDYEGHGRSDGSLGLIKKWDVLVSDVNNFFQEMARKEFCGKKLFLLGESMGGAVAYSIIRENPVPYRGVIFMSPMCKVAADMMPPQWVVDTLRKLIGQSGTVTPFAYLPIAPSRGDLRAFTYKLPYRRALFTRIPSNFARKPRLATASELLNATKKISENLAEFEAPFLVLHGKADRVTDPMLSQALYNEAKSRDKTIRLYEDMWHALTAGEPHENIQIVLKDSIQWILDRAECSNNKKQK